jgi:hypothetical protein
MRPNPWVAVPVLVGGVAGALIGWSVVRASCLPQSCPGPQLAGAAVGAMVAMIGIGVLAVLAVLSLTEWGSWQDDSDGPDSRP